ncbi:MAG TPA: 5'/3'-nucleotidase SurE [Planctomycetaceae bacterium]|nr:5'/3'-nucleotidase SurE [Planctomycetaceae bacterium]
MSQVYTVAPDSQRSECGHGVSSGKPLRIVETGANAWSASGTPADCVRFALANVCPEVDLVLSGINAGANLGTDLMVSGTFAAAREAYNRGVPAIAISQYRHPNVPRTWEHASEWLSVPLRKLVNQILQGDKSLWNVNLPAIDPATFATGQTPESVICPVDRLPIPLRYLPAKVVGEIDVESAQSYHVESDFHHRPRVSGSDIDVCFSGKISISRAIGC